MTSQNETTAKTTERKVGELIPQPHGGALRNGGPNRGGPGRAPSEIRKQLRGDFRERIQILNRIADDEEMRAGDRIRAVELMARYGLGTLTEMSVEEVRDNLTVTISVIRDFLNEDQAKELVERLRPIWQ